MRIPHGAYLLGAVIWGLSAGFSLPGRAATLDVTVLDQKGRPVPHTVVQALPAGGRGALPEKPDTIVIEQKAMKFHPFVTALRRGTIVRFPNNDRVAHHVYSFSPAKVFELPLYKGEPPILVEFDVAGPVTLGCNIHDWMVAYIYVVDTPHFGTTDAKGRLRLTDVPIGVYGLEVWHPGLKGSLKSTRRTVDVADGANAAEFKIQVRAERFWRPRPPI